MQKLINKRVAEAAKLKDKAYQIADTAIPGFVLQIQPSGAKLWRLRYVNDKGRRTTRSLGKMPVMTADMARAKATAILQGNDPDNQPEPDTEILTFESFLSTYYEKYVKQHHSRPSDTLAVLRSFGIGNKPLDEIKLADVESKRLDWSADGKAAASINRHCATLKAALQRAFDWDLLNANPLTKLKRLKTDKRGVVRYLDDDESKRLLAALKARDKQKHQARESANQWRKQRGYNLKPAISEYYDNLTPMVTLAFNTGLRRGELWNLVWGDVNFKTALLTVQGKGSKSKQTRHIPLNKAALTCLKTHRGDVVPMPNNPVFGEHEFKKAFNNILKAANIEKFRFHDLRHTFASRLVMAGVPLNTVRELMGHASLDMTLIYAHLAPDNLRHAVDLIGEEQ